MLQIADISQDSFQTQTVVTDDGLSFYMELYYIPLQLMWVITKLTYNDFTLENHRVCSSPNMLRQFKDLIPFGIACITDDNREPMFSNDFSEGYSKLYLLNEEEVEEYEVFLRGN